MRMADLRGTALRLRDRLSGPPALRLWVRLRRRQNAILATAFGLGLLLMVIHWS